MDFDFSDMQQEIRRTASDLLARRAPMQRLRELAETGGFDEPLWRELCELGWPAITIPDEYGGQGLGAVELALVLEALGHACAPTPLLGSVLAGLAIESAGSAQQRERWLPALASGAMRGALGREGELIADAPGADVVVLVDSEGAGRLIEPGEVDAVSTIDPTRGYARLGAHHGGDPLPGDVSAALDRGAVAIAAELVGLSQRALDLTIAYVKDRKQFGVPVGAFQAVQHTAVQMLRDTEGARAATYFAAWAADAGDDRLALGAAMAKAAASDAARSVTASAIQLHGGIGFTWESDVHWLFKRAQVSSALLGSATAHRARIARLLAGGRGAVTATAG